MNRAYILSTCNTCQRILKESDWPYEVQDIKEKHIDAKTLDQLKKVIGSYEGLFNKRAMKYRSMGLNEMDLTEKQFRSHILKEYTFLKRPVFILEEQVFAGNAKKTVAALVEALP